MTCLFDNDLREKEWVRWVGRIYEEMRAGRRSAIPVITYSIRNTD